MHADTDALSFRCRKCGQDYDVAERLDALLEKVRSRLVTTHELVKLQPVLKVPYTLSGIKGYVARKRLIARGSRGTSALYSVGEFLDLLESK